jgi:hypothetical protein
MFQARICPPAGGGGSGSGGGGGQALGARAGCTGGQGRRPQGRGRKPWWLLAQRRLRVPKPTVIVVDGLDVRRCHASGGGRSDPMCCLLEGGGDRRSYAAAAGSRHSLNSNEAFVGRRDNNV